MQDPLNDRPLRVGIVTHYWLPHMGGIEVMARDQAHALADRGWDVTVFTSRLRGDPADSREGSVRVRRFRCTNILETRLGVPVPLMTPSMLRALIRAARDLDVIVAHGHVYMGTVFAILTSQLTRTPAVLVQSNPFVKYANPVLNSLQRFADKTIGKATLQRATEVVAISDFTKRYVTSVAPKARANRIYPGVDLNRFHPQPIDYVTHRSRPLFITARRLVPRNGVESLIRAWQSGGVGHHADLAVIGDGPLKAELLKLARPDPTIRFVGRLSDAELPKFYRAADVFVLPTLSGEGYGLALSEALASGLPAIVTGDGAPPELVDHLTNGLIVPTDDFAVLAKQMNRLAIDVALRESLAMRARAGRTELDQERAFESLDTLLGRVASSGRHTELVLNG